MKQYTFNGATLKEVRESLEPNLIKFLEDINTITNTKVWGSMWRKMESDKRNITSPNYVISILEKYCSWKIDRLKTGFTIRPIKITEISKEWVKEYWLK